MGERITGVAIKSLGNVWALPAPHRHCHIYALAAFTNQHPNLEASEEGFMTDAGRFVDRREAYQIAIASGQEVRHGISSLELYSEDVW